MPCSKCNYDNPADAPFCMKCGTKFENRWSSCNTVKLVAEGGTPVEAGIGANAGEVVVRSLQTDGGHTEGRRL